MTLTFALRWAQPQALLYQTQNVTKNNPNIKAKDAQIITICTPF
jgi:hypothetical protein